MVLATNLAMGTPVPTRGGLLPAIDELPTNGGNAEEPSSVEHDYENLHSAYEEMDLDEFNGALRGVVKAKAEVKEAVVDVR